MPDSTETFEFRGDATNFLAAKALVEAELQKARKSLKDMATESVRTGKEGGQAFQDMARKVAGLEGQLGGAKRQMSQFNKEAEGGRISMEKLANVVGAGSLIAMIKNAAAAQIEWNKQIHAGLVEYDKLAKKVQVQGLFSDEEFKKQMSERIVPIAHKYGVSKETTMDTVRELLNQGVIPSQATGPVLEEILAGAQATGTDDVRTFAEGVTGYLRASGRDMNAEGARSVSQALAGAFEKNRLQASDIGELSKIGALLATSGVSQEDAFALFTTLRHEGNLPAGEATTALRNVTAQMQGFKGTIKKKDILEQIGGKGFTEQIDLTGESLPQALMRLKSAIGQQPEEQQAAIVKELFGLENLAAFKTLTADTGIKAYQQKLKDIRGGPESLRKGLAITTQGPAATANRQKLAGDLAQIKQAEANQEWNEMMAEYDVLLAEEGVPGWGRGVVETVVEAGGLAGVTLLDEQTKEKLKQRLAARREVAVPQGVEAAKVPGAPPVLDDFRPGPGRQVVDFRRAHEKEIAKEERAEAELPVLMARRELDALQLRKKERERQYLADDKMSDREKRELGREFDRPMREAQIALDKAEAARLTDKIDELKKALEDNTAATVKDTGQAPRPVNPRAK